MKTKTIVKLFLLVNIGIFTSCENNSEEDLIIAQPISNVVTYNENIKPIIDNNCVSCHAANPVNGAGISLNNYTNVKNALENAGLINRISASAGSPQIMPPSGRMPQQTIDLILKWQTDGLLE